jgi:hypothetical protein
MHFWAGPALALFLLETNDCSFKEKHMKFFAILALSFNLLSLTAHAESAAKASVKDGQALCRKMQGFMSHPVAWFGVGQVDSKCDRFVLENQMLSRQEMALAICKSPDLDGRSRSNADIAACLEKAADLNSDRVGATIEDKGFQVNSERCKGTVFCLKNLFQEAVNASQKKDTLAINVKPALQPRAVAKPATAAPLPQNVVAPQQAAASPSGPVPTLKDPREQLKARERIALRKGIISSPRYYN